MPPRTRLLCAVATAALWYLAGRQSGWFALGWVALVPMLWALYGLPRRPRWRLAYLTGIISYALLNWWVIPTISHSSPVVGIPEWGGAALGSLGVVIIALVHGLQVGLVGLLWSPEHPLARRAPWLLPVAVAAAWLVCDVVRCESELAHAWGALAYTQWRDVALLQTAAVIGQHGLSALCVWFAACLGLWARTGRATLWRLPIGVFAVLHLAGAWRLMTAPTEPPSLQVVLVQTNVAGRRTGREVITEAALPQALRLTREALQARHRPCDLVIWPETVATLKTPTGGTQPVGLDRVEIGSLSREFKVPILFGAQHFAFRNAPQPLLQNVAVLATPDGKLQFNAKRQVVPFGERAPYSDVLPFLRQLAPSTPVTPADRSEPLTLPGGRRLGTLICFESCFRNPARALRGAGADAFFVVTNDEWSHGTSSPWDHAVMSVVRAVENGVPIAQAGNTGYSFIVDRYGRFVLNQGLKSPSYPRDFISHEDRAEALAGTLPLPAEK